MTAADPYVPSHLMVGKTSAGANAVVQVTSDGKLVVYVEPPSP